MQEQDIRPDYYNKGIEVFDIIDTFDLNFYLGNVVKYVCRCQYKDKTKKIEDLVKARTYINKQIDIWQKEQEDSKEGRN